MSEKGITGEDLLESFNYPANSYLAFNVATSEITNPTVLEFYGTFGDTGESFRYFIEPPDNVYVPDDLNYTYTKIPRAAYNESKVTPLEFMREFFVLLEQHTVTYSVINSDNWLGQVVKGNPHLSPLWATLEAMPAMSLLDYENARVSYKYAMQDYTYYDRIEDVFAKAIYLAKKGAKGYRMTLEACLINRKKIVKRDITNTVAQEYTDFMTDIWKDVLQNDKMEESYWEGGFV